jgi:alpha-beta hydrolase superfamily lysophospholipase
MLSLSRSRIFVALALGLLLLPGSPTAFGQAKKANSKRVTFKTFDGVELGGTFYPAEGGGKKEGCVLLLHAFDPKKGGSSHADGWDRLAAQLQKAGYSVLSFDFRGFGDSKTINPVTFWKFSHNNLMRRRKGQETIDHKDFLPAYYPQLVNDIAAAKAFLDRRNDAGEINSSNLIVIGAGDGATLGALWLANLCRLRREKTPPLAAIAPPDLANLGDPESKDIAAAVWLSISPSIAGRSVGLGLQGWLKEAGQQNKIPMAFIYGKGDAKGETLAKTCLRTVKGKTAKPPAFTGDKGIAGTSLKGSALLQRDLDTEKWIVKNYLEPVTDGRTARESTTRGIEKVRYYYWTGRGRPLLAKQVGEDVPHVNISLFGLR